ncbi:MOB kinase activator 1A-like isoform X1 [Anneissia japonica]|uniref:MOB kinase activator 1A-like isoform X1 n=1 Tax=Anneissia japonica TaxID=1529436 RepID=UPI0014255517|nr:MOB kinase activator 1A-like isoform X1 [Anneissia japonica]
MSFLFSTRSKTFRPKKNIPEGTHQYDLMKHAERTLGSGNLRQAVALPEGEELNEWVAVNTVDFFNQINMLYGTITEFCTPEKCPIMSAGPKGRAAKNLRIWQLHSWKWHFSTLKRWVICFNSCLSLFLWV